MSDSDLTAICSLKFYRNQKNWVFARDKKVNSKKAKKPNSNRALNQTYNVDDVNTDQNCLEKFTEHRKIDFRNNKIIIKNEEYQTDKQNEVKFGNMGSKESINMKSSINSQNDLNLAQIEGKDNKQNDVNFGNMGSKESVNMKSSINSQNYLTLAQIEGNDNKQNDVNFGNMCTKESVNFKSFINSQNYSTLAQIEGKDNKQNDANMSTKESNNLTSSINSQNYLTLAQIESKGEDRYIYVLVQNPKACIADAEYAMIDQTEASANLNHEGWPKEIALCTNNCNNPVVSEGMWSEKCVSFSPEPNPQHVEAMDHLQRALLRADIEPVHLEEGTGMCGNVGYFETAHRSNPAQYYPEKQPIDENYLQQLLKHQPLVCQAVERDDASTDTLDWQTGSEDILNQRIQSERLAEMYEQGFVAGQSQYMVQDLDPPYHRLPSQHLMEALLDGDDSWWCESVESSAFMAGAHSAPHSSEIELREGTPQTAFCGDNALEVWRQFPDEPDQYPTRDIGPTLAQTLDHRFQTGLNAMAQPFRPNLPFLEPPFRPRSPLFSLTSRPSVSPGFSQFDDVILAGSRVIVTGDVGVCVGRGRGRLHRP